MNVKILKYQKKRLQGIYSGNTKMSNIIQLTVPQRAGGAGGPLAPPKILPSSKSFFLLLSKYFDWKDTKLHANYFLYNEKCCFPSYKSNTVSFISINYKSSFFSLCIEIYLCTPCALFFNCFPKLRELKGTHL